MRIGGRLPFTKMQGVGNDMIVVDARSGVPHDWADLARAMCARRTGIGADGLLVVGPSLLADATMLMYNPDGTSDFCGNGLRSVARYVAERPVGTAPRAPGEACLRFETLAGIREARVAWDRTGECSITVDMGHPRFRPEDVPMLAQGERFWEQPISVDGIELSATVLSTGSAHTVVFVDALPDDALFYRLSPQVETHPLFPERTSVMWAHVVERRRVELRIWERGAGETLGCGTGACAAAVACRVAGLTDPMVTVASKGGELQISWEEGRPIHMTGPAEYVYEGEYLL